MFDFDVGKLLVIGLVALIVIGPKELPRVLRQTGQMVGKLRRMAGEFQQQFSDALRESELDQIKKDVAEMAESAKVDMNYDMAYEAEREIREAVESKPDTGKSDAAKSGDNQSAAQANATAAARPAVRNPTPENDTDSVFVDIDIPRAEEPVIHAPVREVGLDTPAPADTARAAAQKAPENVTSKAS